MGGSYLRAKLNPGGDIFWVGAVYITSIPKNKLGISLAD